jgi:tetratricopeptide (TPR) repeat protein
MPDQPKFDYDVFISYSSHDKAWVRGELLTRIEQAGLKAFIDYRDFTRGAPSIKEMERGVVECRKTLLILTPDYVESEWCDLEAIMVQTLTPANRKLRIIPLLKKECEKPLHVGALTHVDFTDGADLDLAWRQLLTALGAPPEPEPPPEPEHDDWFLAHPYPMPPNFTGRVDERAMLTRWMDEDAAHPLLVLRALGGFGKSALAWQWLTHDVKFAKWPRVVWWSFYEGDASFDHFLADTLHSLSDKTIKPGELVAKDAVKKLLEMLHAPGTLLVLDGFERVLRAFGGMDAAYRGDEPGKEDHNDQDCISPLAELFLHNIASLPNLRSKVLLTTRLCPRVVEAKGGGFLQGCREEELERMQPADAVEFFRAEGIRGTRAEIEQACEPYGYHPLSLRLLAGLIVGDFQQPGDIAAAKRLDVSGDLVQRQHHVLEVAYSSLAPKRQKLLSRIACFRSPVRYDALKALTWTEPPHPALSPESGGEGMGVATLSTIGGEGARRAGEGESRTETGTLDADLRDLVARGLLHHDAKEGRFDLHPIVRRYAYDRLAAPDRAAAHTHLRDYFAAVPKPDKVTRLEDLAPVIELYHHTVRAGQYTDAEALYYNRLSAVLYFHLGAYPMVIDLLSQLFPDGLDKLPSLDTDDKKAFTLNELANSYSLSGQPRRAVPLFEQHNAIYEKTGNKSNLAIGLGNVAIQQLVIGALRAAEANVRRRIALAQEIQQEFNEAIGYQELSRLLAYRGAYAESETELATALNMLEEQKSVQSQGITWAYRALRELLLLRHAEVIQSPIANRQSGTPPARHALELADETANDSRFVYPVRDYIRAHWLLGAAHLVASQFGEAEHHLHEALERCRRINMVDHEADILIDLARLRAATPSAGSGQAALDEAQRLAEEALVITERSGYVLQGADARLELAKLALARNDKATALMHAKEARRLATCDGPPDYTYKAAYDEAGALLAELESDPRDRRRCSSS